jgi:hypothetical protein
MDNEHQLGSYKSFVRPGSQLPSRNEKDRGDVVRNDGGAATPNLRGEVSATLQSTAAFQAEQDEVHAVVVDMPEVMSLEYASPETWGNLPMPVQPYDQPSATPVFQLATNEVKSSASD